MPKLLDLTGQRFGQLVALEATRLGGRPAWLCQCDCGGTKVIRTASLQSGNSKSCGLPGRHIKGAPLDVPMYGPLISRDLAKERGYKWYVIGLPCKRGHVCERQTANARCRECGAEGNAENCKQWYGKNKVTQMAAAKDWAQQNRDKRRLIAREHSRRVRAVPERNAEIQRRRREGNRRELHRIRYQVDQNYRLLLGLKGRVQCALKLQSAAKAHKTAQLLGVSVPEFKEIIAAKFTGDMSWDNYGYETWHLDHIRPCDSFDLTDPAQQLICFNWRNQQPLPARENMSKNAAWTPEMEAEWAEHMLGLGWEGDLSLVFEPARLAA